MPHMPPTQVQALEVQLEIHLRAVQPRQSDTDHICGYEALLVDFLQKLSVLVLRLQRKARCRSSWGQEIVTFPSNENERTLDSKLYKYICWNTIEFGPWVKCSRSFSR